MYFYKALFKIYFMYQINFAEKNYVSIKRENNKNDKKELNKKKLEKHLIFFLYLIFQIDSIIIPNDIMTLIKLFAFKLFLIQKIYLGLFLVTFLNLKGKNQII